MADYPTNKKTFTALIDGTTYMEAVNVNVVYDEVEAVQLFIGASGAAQSHNASLLELLQGNYVGLRCYKKDDDEIYVGPGTAIITNAAASVKKLRVNSSVTTLSASNLDTGAFAVDFYYIYAVADASGSEIAFVISLSDSAPTGYTHYKKIGWFYNETASALDITSGFIGNIMDGTGSPNVCQIVGTTDASTTNTSFEDMATMEVKFVSNGRPVELFFNAAILIPATGTSIVETIFDVDGSNVASSLLKVGGYSINNENPQGRQPQPMRITLFDLAAGEHTIKVQWKVSTGTAYQYGSTDSSPRILTVKEL